MTINTDHTSDTLTPTGGTLNVSGGVGLTTALPIASGGTGQTTANTALNALLPSQATNAGKVLSTDGSNTSWLTVGGTGTVTSVDVSGGTTGLTTSGGPITGSGTITLAGTLGLANGGTEKTTAPASMANLMGFDTTVTSASPVALTNTSAYQQYFTGSTAQTITLPDVTTLAQGWSFLITNNSTANITLNSSGGNLVATIYPGLTGMPTCILTTGTTAASWDYGLAEFNNVSGTGSVVLNTQPTVTGLALAAGTTTVAPLDFVAGTNLTTASAGAMEYDGSAFYSSVATSTRGVMPSEQMVVLGSTYTLTSQTAAQKLFNATTNGAVTLPVGTYQFECHFTLTSMSSASGTFGFSLVAGTAVIASQGWFAVSIKTSNMSQGGSAVINFNTGANTALVTANTSTNAISFIRGTIRVTTAGTIIPSVSLTQAAAAVVGANSYFKISPISGTGTAATNLTVGNWS